MSYTKKSVKSRAASKVCFSVDAEQARGNKAVYLVGSFNNWEPNSMPMKKQKDGSFALELELPTGEKHLFRYLGGDGQWFNDLDAEGYEANGVCDCTNCVIWV
ncbi:MAG: isoamylase early set domain-containing protein [Desulfovibrionaceae bacterium]|nr:isoamylase early set domain-containing protein [Desulfovibrionaceae bacterium]